MDIHSIMELIALIGAIIGIGTILYERIKTGKSIGARVIQLCVVILVFPTIIIFGLEGKLNEATIGTLIGGIMGYVLSGVGNYEPSSRKDDKN